MSNGKKDENNVRLTDLNLPGDLRKLSIAECRTLCREIRNILKNTVSKTGGHLASNLGVVELTLAIHRMFDSPNDKIVWDVGHQCYTHKLLTGRAAKFSTLRQEGGLSGFPKPSESEHDAFISGHSSTSISVACAAAEAMRINGNDKNYAIAVIGDGAFTGGMAYEGLNNAGKSDCNLIVILNDNTMSISKNVGALAKYLASIRGSQDYVKTKFAVERTLGHTPVIGAPLTAVIRNSKSAMKRVLYKNTMFDELGFVYLGPVDGHDLEALEEVLMAAKAYKRPVLVHVSTKKGKGYLPAEKNPGEYHGVSRFDIITGNPEVSGDDCYSAVFGRELAAIGNEDDRVCAITAAMKYGTGLQYFASEHRDRFFDVGIAEQHAVTFAAGLASMGMLPVFAVYSSFLQRACDQLIHDAAIGGYHIVIGIDRAGIVGDDGETHQGLFDVSMLTLIPGVTIYSPASYDELKLCLRKAAYHDKGIACVRYPRGGEPAELSCDTLNTSFSHLREKDAEILIITYGRIFESALCAAGSLRTQGIKCSCLKLTRIFPIGEEIIEAVKSYKHVFFFEEGVKTGGIAMQLAGMLMETGFSGSYKIIAAEGFVRQASVKRALELLGLDSAGMEKIIKESIGNGRKTGRGASSARNGKKQTKS